MRRAFALEITPGNAAGGVEFLLVIDSQRQEVDTFAWAFRRHCGGEDGGLTVGGEHGAIGLPRHPAGF